MIYNRRQIKIVETLYSYWVTSEDNNNTYLYSLFLYNKLNNKNIEEKIRVLTNGITIGASEARQLVDLSMKSK